MKRQNRSVYIIVIAAIAGLMIGALGVIFSQNFIPKATQLSSVSKSATENNKDSSEKVAEEGTISGTLTYPSEGIPPNMTVHAINLDTHNVYSTDVHLTGSQYTTGYGYRLSVPAGSYYVYGTKGSDLSKGADYAFYNQFIKCGTKVTCKDYAKIKVTVVPNKDTENIMVGDWWTTKCTYNDSEATINWLLLPACHTA